jgi:trk system potassium uptake protein
MRSRKHKVPIGLEGALLVLSPLLLLLPFSGNGTAQPASWQLILAGVATGIGILCALVLARSPLIGGWLGCATTLLGFTVFLPVLAKNPFAALSAAIGLIFIIATLYDFITAYRGAVPGKPAGYIRQQARWAALAIPAAVVARQMLDIDEARLGTYVIGGVAVLAQILFVWWAIKERAGLALILSGIGLAAMGYALLVASGICVTAAALVMSVVNLATLPRLKARGPEEEHWWDSLLNHPARILVTTFFSLCAIGTALLSMPAATKNGVIETVDAVFTAVSAVCVTGLIVLDTPHDFTLFGQFCILLLIQLGGLGIMSITTVALHTLGQRLSLKQERLMTSMTGTDRTDLVHSLATILKFTFIAEGLGALALSTLFISAGDAPAQGIWRGVFTAISAFCNAGFALQSDSLVSYQTNPLVLQTIATLIIFGGMAPATSLIIPRWLSGKSIPLSARIALITTVAMLIAGTFFILSFEWNGILYGLSTMDKIQNAWFQSATLRTAGFNSVDFSGITGPAFMVMVAFMFIGGSPGGTAGGVKTTTIAILAITFWTSIANRNEVIVQNRRIHARTIYRAVTVVASGAAIWFLVVLMLEVTQQISSRDLVFEATSAIGTVGLSTGATAHLDEVGKIIISIAMFIGRVGPATLFMLLSSEQPISDTRHPEATISIT